MGLGPKPKNRSIRQFHRVFPTGFSVGAGQEFSKLLLRRIAQGAAALFIHLHDDGLRGCYPLTLLLRLDARKA